MAEDGGGPLAAVFAAPGRYIQGRGAIGKLGEVLEQLGASKLLIHEPFEVYAQMVVDAKLSPTPSAASGEP
jgi:glycerol dehydrogenase-like iron-containing ADH family enzyme